MNAATSAATSAPGSPPPAFTPLPRWARVLNAPFIGAIWLYRITLSPLMGGHCRFQPTCSVYGLEAYRTFGPFRGTWLTFRRVIRCQPFGGKGFDPVPLRSACRHARE